ncbi:MAG: transaldolase [Labilithrix sp.]|nr:transaldolase [Labilithrix sp.]MCW5816829.1 transaldolase [Labilithrix sp.]
MNRIERLEELGQSVWLDYLDHELLTTGELGRMAEKEGLRGVTSNPTIFEKAIAKSTAYDAAIREAEPDESDGHVLEALMTRELMRACDELRACYERLGGADGFASIEVDPTLANDTPGQIEQALRLWETVDRPNLMVKIPATRPGVTAIRACLGHGVNINVTLLFSVSRYREVLEAFLAGLEHRAAANERLDDVASVASFFVSRVDAKVDALLDEASPLRGRVAVANARLAYAEYEKMLATPRWKALAARGARPQRLLWASTTPKQKDVADTYYVDALVGPNTVDTMTRETLEAFTEHGDPQDRLHGAAEEAERTMKELAAAGVDFAKVAAELEDEGVAAFAESYEESLRAIADKRSFGSSEAAKVRPWIGSPPR